MIINIQPITLNIHLIFPSFSHIKYKCDACNRIEFPVELTNKAMLEQRIVYFKRLLDESGLIQYGITEAEIKSFASRPLTETITILIELRKLADNTVMDSGTDKRVGDYQLQRRNGQVRIGVVVHDTTANKGHKKERKISSGFNRKSNMFL